MPVIASTHEALRVSSTSTSREPAVEPFAGALCLEPDQLGADPRRRAAEPLEILVRQVHASVLVVLADVAQDIGQLHRDAEVVGQARVLADVAAGEDRQAQPSDRARDVAAVDDELVEGLVPGPAHVELDAVDQQLERLERQREAPTRVGQRRPRPGPLRIRSARCRRSPRGRALGVERGQLGGRGAGLVADVVDPPRERVDGAHRLALFARSSRIP